MTSLIGWVGVDSRGCASLYLASDGRISWPDGEVWDSGRKLFTSRATPDPALVFKFYQDRETPNAGIPRVASVIDDATRWMGFWQTSLFFPLADALPAVDFSTRSIVTVVDDRVTYGEIQPVLTNVTNGGRMAVLVFPAAEGTQRGVSYHRRVYVFQTGKLAHDATVRVSTLCNP